MPTKQPEPLLEDVIAEKVKEWVRRASARMEQESDWATLKIHLHDLGYDDDGTPLLDARLEEKVISEDISGRVPR